LTNGRFEIDDVGFRTQMSEVPLWRLTQEIISNSFDEKSVTEITCIVTKSAGKVLDITIEDNGTGFLNTKDIFTLYRDSYKRVNPEQAGRYNEGEKRFLAVAHRGLVQTKEIEYCFQAQQTYHVPIISTSVLTSFWCGHIPY